MASKNQLKMVERLAKKNVAATRRTKEAGEASQTVAQIVEEPKAKRPKTIAISAHVIPEKSV
ncbi:hypothetical protein SESBI_50681 [Sesbania bispinosa]|nr:hypothetical protein SESBI_50681 [Sesbania bispinosa]